MSTGNQGFAAQAAPWKPKRDKRIREERSANAGVAPQTKTGGSGEPPVGITAKLQNG